MSGFMGSDLYGGAPAVQPGTAAAAVAAPQGSAPAPAQTVSHSAPGVFANPTFWWVALLGVVLGVIHISVRSS